MITVTWLFLLIQGYITFFDGNPILGVTVIWLLLFIDVFIVTQAIHNYKNKKKL